MSEDFNPDTHIEVDGKVYERKIVAASFVAVGLQAEGHRTAFAAALEAAMSKAAAGAHAEGITSPEEIKARMLTARENLLGSESHG